MTNNLNRTLCRTLVIVSITMASVLSVACRTTPAGEETGAAHASLDLIRVVDRRIVMGVEGTITVFAPSESVARDATSAAFARMAALEQALSDYRPQSEAMLAVETVDEPVSVSDDLMLALQRSDLWHRRSGGAFDPAIGPVTLLWRDARRAGAPPPAAAIDFARASSGWDKVALDVEQGTVRFRTAAMRLDFGGIGKGLAADLALQTLATRGITRALVEIGGDLVAGDPPPGRDGWRVTIETLPWDDAVEFELAHAAVATSGDVEQFLEIEEDGATVRLGHLLDPRTGRPVRVRRQTTAIVRGGAFNGADADAMASVGAILGLRGAARVADGTLDADLRVVEATSRQADGATPDDWRVESLRFTPDPDWAGDLQAETVCDGFSFTEGPVVRSDGSVWFTDQPNDRIVRWSADDGCETMIEPAGRSNGLAVDAEGRLLACAEASSELVRFEANGEMTVLASGDPAAFNGPNDLWVAPDGAVWFTDPWYRRPWHENDDWRREPAVHRLDPDGTCTVAAAGFRRPNGIVGTPDGETLFVADIDAGVLWRYPIEGDRLGERTRVVPLGSDGMVITGDGKVLLTGRGVFVVDPARNALVRTLVADEPWCANVTADSESIWITARDRLLRVPNPLCWPLATPGVGMGSPSAPR